MRLIISLIILVILIAVASTVVFWDKQQTNTDPRTPTPTQVVTQNPNVPKTEVLAENLSVPWDIAFHPEGDILFTERQGAVKRLYLTTDKHVQTVATIDDVLQTGESGLHGIAFHPDFKTNHYLYLYYTYGSSGENTQNRVVRFIYENDSLQNRTVIVDEIPGAIFHDGGRIRFGPDGFLYIATGDAQVPSLAQDKNSLAGKILRVTGDGKPAPGNPFGTRIYSYGHRNPQGLAWDDTGSLWETEHGQSATDEVNHIESGNNYGWPDIRGNATRNGMVSPISQSGSFTTWAPASIAYHNGSLYFGGLRGQALFEAVLDGQTITEIIPHFQEELGRIRAVTLGPDNMLYISTSNRDGRGNPKTGDDKIIRVNPEKL